MLHVTDTKFVDQICFYHGIKNNTPIKVKLDYLAEGAANVIFSIIIEYDQIPNTDPDINIRDPSKVTSIVEHENSSKYVLRLRKNLPFTIPVQQALKEFEEQIAPLCLERPTLLLPPISFPLTLDVVDAINDELLNLEITWRRSEQRRGVYLPGFEDEKFGLLMPNLNFSPKNFSSGNHVQDGSSGVDVGDDAGSNERDVEEISIEFKPKWLTQSPSAPSNAQRCRTCALNLMRRVKNKNAEQKGRGDSGLCPFDLLSTNNHILLGALRPLWNKFYPSAEEYTEQSDKLSIGKEELLHQFAEEFREHVQPALRHLQELQRQYDRVGLDDFLHPDDEDCETGDMQDEEDSENGKERKPTKESKNFGISMALRDCSCFLRVSIIQPGIQLSTSVTQSSMSTPHVQQLRVRPGSITSAIDGEGLENQHRMVKIRLIKLLDLDLKDTGGGKLEKWADMEKKLIEGGWYTDVEKEKDSLDSHGCAMAFR